MTAVLIESYIKTKSPQPKTIAITVGVITLYFSYEICVAFTSPLTGLVISDTKPDGEKWSQTTRRHLVQIELGFDQVSRTRIPGDDFQRRLSEITERIEPIRISY
jgi:hypothetical protein